MAAEIRSEKNMSREEEVAAQEEIWNYILGFTPTAIIKCAIELGIPDILESHESLVTLADLTLELGCSEASLHRIMRFLIHYKVFQETPISETSVGYALTPISRLLTRHGKHSMVDLLLLESSPIMLAPWHKLSAWVLGNTDLPFKAEHGKDLWGFVTENPGHSKLLNDAMACDARVAVGAVIEGCPEVFEGLNTLVDVGGGDGTALRLIVEACPWIKGINFDLPHVLSVAPASNGVEHVGGNMFDHIPNADAVYLMALIKGCPEVFEGLRTMVDVGGSNGTALRLIVEAFPWIKGINFDLPHVVSVAPDSKGVEHVGGNMFDHVPKADAVFFMKVLHDWAHEECIDILKKCREAIPRNTGKVIIVDTIIGRKEDHDFKGVGLMLDMVMMAHTSKGKERTSKEWSYVLNESGFTRYTIKYIQACQSIIEINA